MFRHPLAFWTGALLCVGGVVMHLPMYLSAGDMGYRMADMEPDLTMVLGMVAIVAGLALSFWGLLPERSGAIRRQAAAITVRPMDDVPIRFAHVALLVVMALAITIDVMKPTTLSFVAPGVAREYGLTGAHRLLVTWLPLSGITGTVTGSFLWGWAGDRIGRRASIVFAGILFVSTSICGAMPGFGGNVLMCFLMGIGAGGMLPIAFVLIAETIPARHRGWLIVLIGGDIAGAYVITSWLAGALTPEFSWRVLWLIGLPTGLLLILLNRWIPESPRYLFAAGHPKQAEAVMARYGARMVDRDVDEPAPGWRSGDPDTVEPAPVRRSGYRDLFFGLAARPTAAITLLAVAAGLLTYGFQFWVPTNLQHLGLTEVNSDYVLRDSAVLGLPLTIVVSLLYGFWGSRRTMICLSALTVVAVGVFAVFGESIADKHFLLAALLVVPLSGISSIVAVVTAYASEVYPTVVRSHAVGWTAGMTKAGGVLILIVVLGGIAAPSLLVTGLLGAVPLLVAILVFARTSPETKQRRLEDIAGMAVDRGQSSIQ
ncbi:putative MFS transporter [Actinocrispum wychmicini]|uniref:Putative MFS transporter n=2 Tax=Actinocrispum wychmicini TaxID=1213861 RepID=A0A4R2JDV7_9PSEU|nr:putative MFS transporter [Actinocrispum wychmicini]